MLFQDSEMAKEQENEKCRHSNYTNQHPNSPLRAVRPREITEVSNIADSATGTSPPIAPARAAAPATASTPLNAPTTHYATIEFKKPTAPPKRGLVKSKDKFPLQKSIEKSINAVMISENGHDFQKADKLDLKQILTKKLLD